MQISQIRKFLTRGALLLPLALSVSAFAEDAKPAAPAFTADFEKEDVLKDWKDVNPQYVKIEEGFEKTKSLMMERPVAIKVGDRRINLPLKIEDLRGHKLRLEAMVKAEDVVAPPNAWQGVKFMIHYKVGEKNSYAQISSLAGTFDWQKVEFKTAIPAEATEASLYLGLENTNGRVWFDNIQIHITDAPASTPAAH